MNNKRIFTDESLATFVDEIKSYTDGKVKGLATVATSGSYNDLTNKPTIPTKVSELTNDSGFIQEGVDNAFLTALVVDDYIIVNGWNVTDELDTLDKRLDGLATVANTGSYNDLTNKPTIPESTSDLENDSGFIEAHTDASLNSLFVADSIEVDAGGTLIVNGMDVETSIDNLARRKAFGNVKVGSTTIVADAVTDTLTLVAGDNITLTPNAINDTITISATGLDYEDENLETESKELVGAINEINSKTIDKIAYMEQNQNVDSLDYDESYGVCVTNTTRFLDGNDAPLAEVAFGQSIPIVAGKNIIFEVDEQSNVVKINNAGGNGVGRFDESGSGGELFNDASEATGEYSHAEGRETSAIGYYSHAEGFGTSAEGTASHAEGSGVAAGHYSHAEGAGTRANYCSHAEGFATIALSHQHAQGHYNNTSTTNAGFQSGNEGTAFVIGNGTVTSASNAFRVDYDGQAYGLKPFSSTGADYAEFFEWLDSNPNNEDRRGYFVTLEGDKIKIANTDDYILGIISGLPAIIGNGDEDWRGRYVHDEFGAFIVEEFEYEEKIFDKETKEAKIVTKIGTKYKENPDYDQTTPYIQREDRPEWDTVGMLGVLSVRDDGTCQVNGYCKVAEGGIATAAESGYRVIKRVSENVVKVIFR